MTAIILNEGKDKINRQYQTLIFFMVFNLLTIGIAFLFLSKAAEEKKTNSHSYQSASYERFVEKTNDHINELEEQFSELNANFKEFQRDLYSRVQTMVKNAGDPTKREQSRIMTMQLRMMMMEELLVKNLNTSRDLLTEFKNVSQTRFESLQNRIILLENGQDNSYIEKLAKNLNESNTVMDATIADLKQVTSSHIDTIYLLINELVAKCNWLQEKMGF